MKTTFKFLYVALGSVFILALFSFTKNRLSSTGNKSVMQKNNAAAIKASPVAALVSDGTNSIIYTAGGILFKVVGSSFKETRYSITPAQDETLYTASVYDNGVITNKYTYKVNSSGLASNIITEQFDNGKPWLSWSDSCIYNISGQLTRRLNGNGHYDFIYDDKGDVSNVRYYNFQNKLLRNIVLHYADENASLLSNRNNLTPENLELDPYLNVFGKFSNHLPVRTEDTDNATGGDKADYSYSYVLDNRGYILSSKKYVTGSEKIVETKSLTYKL